MFSLPLPTTSAPLCLSNFEARKASLWRHIARSEKFADVHPATQFEVRPRPEMLASGVAALDAVSGGIPCGCITVICGAASSGKTSVLLAALARNTRDDGNSVLIDASDSFDPKSAAAAEVNFSRLLWVRCGGGKGREPRTNGVSAHDARRTTHDQQPRAKSQEPRAGASPSEIRLEQVLKTTDLILQSGGFGLIALDLAGIPEKFVRRIPLASWFRFQRAVEHTKTALLVISEFSCAQTCAALVLELQSSVASCESSVRGQHWSVLDSEPMQLPPHAELLQQLHVEAELVRSRLERKPMQSVKASFITKAVRAG